MEYKNASFDVKRISIKRGTQTIDHNVGHRPKPKLQPPKKKPQEHIVPTMVGTSSHSGIENLPRYKYKPFPNDRSIRLIELLPAIEGDAISIKLSVALLDRRPYYEALSYEWGLPFTDSTTAGEFLITLSIRYDVSIFCDGYQMPITSNLHGILQRLRYNDRSRILWIDGICINQEDTSERSQQVLLMKQVYRQASIVLSWIGEDNEDTAGAFRTISKLGAVSRVPAHGDREKFYREGLTVDEEVLNELNTETMPGVEDVFTRSYFGRIWVVQEIVLAKYVVIICGRFQVSWQDFVNANVMLVLLGMFDLERIPETSEEIVQFMHKWCRVQNIGKLSHTDGDRTLSLTVGLENLLDHQATNPLDRVYGVLGMIDPQSSYTRDCPIKVDYTKSVQDVFQETCEWCIKDLNSLLVLELCDAPATNLVKGLPTWVPDLSKGPRKCGRRSALAIVPSIQPLSIFNGQFFALMENKTLSVKAIIFDKVVKSGSPFISRFKLVAIMRLFYRFSTDNEKYQSGCSKLEAFWRCLLGNAIINRDTPGQYEVSTPPAEFGVHFMNSMAHAFLYNLGLPHKLTGQEKDLRELARGDSWLTLDELFPDDVDNNISIPALVAKQPFIRLLYDGLLEGDQELWKEQVNGRDYLCDGDEGRQFFLTVDGFMGVGPPCPPVSVENGTVYMVPSMGVMANDVVAVLAGSNKVWVLRGKEKGIYTIVGQAYVHSVVEADWWDPDELPEMETIHIV